jgi:hypothetical protein
MADIVLDYLFDKYLRPYQVRWLQDAGRFRVALKARQIGMSDAIALEMVLVASGLMRGRVRPADCNIISKTADDAFDVVDKCKRWVEILRTSPRMAPFLVAADDGWSASEIKFRRLGYRIKSDTQNPNAGRGKSGHLYLDEYAFYQYQQEIWSGALPSVFSNPDLRVSVTTTPNGFGDHYHELWTDTVKYAHWGRHKIDVYDAIADGFPLVVDDVRPNFTADLWEQEMECKFIGGELEYFTADMLRDATAERSTHGDAVLWLGIDTASIVDTTAVQCVWVQSDGIWLGDTYTLPHVQYETDVQRRRLGQVSIVDALIRHLGARGAIIDVTGDMARRVRGIGSLYTLLRPLHAQVAILPQTITREWKDSQVQDCKSALQVGRVRFDARRVDYVYSKKNASSYADQFIIPQARLQMFTRECFEASAWPILTSDFRKIHRKWTGANQTTFDARRDGQGHGDSFWAAILGLSVAYSQQSTPARVQQQVVAAQPSYAGYL